jgi:DNA-binding XRE family transcriptional regulator
MSYAYRKVNVNNVSEKTAYTSTIYTALYQKLSLFTFTGMSTRKKWKPLDPEDQKRKFGERLKQLRKQAGYSSAETFANEKGFQRATYTKWEQGKPDLNIEYDNILALCNSYGVTLPEFYSEGFDN